jgi:hypothetical protein
MRGKYGQGAARACTPLWTSLLSGPLRKEASVRSQELGGPPSSVIAPRTSALVFLAASADGELGLVNRCTAHHSMSLLWMKSSRSR